MIYRASLITASTTSGNMRQNYQIKQNHKIKEDIRIYGIGLQRFYTTYKEAEVIGNIRRYRNKIKMLQMFLAETADWCCPLPAKRTISDHTTVGTRLDDLWSGPWLCRLEYTPPLCLTLVCRKGTELAHRHISNPLVFRFV